jgi:hypothetical protein
LAGVLEDEGEQQVGQDQGVAVFIELTIFAGQSNGLLDVEYFKLH